MLDHARHVHRWGPRDFVSAVKNRRPGSVSIQTMKMDGAVVRFAASSCPAASIFATNLAMRASVVPARFASRHAAIAAKWKRRYCVATGMMRRRASVFTRTKRARRFWRNGLGFSNAETYVIATSTAASTSASRPAMSRERSRLTALALPIWSRTAGVARHLLKI